MTGRQSWEQSWRADPRARVLADRHYNRQKVGARQFVPPGRCKVLLTLNADALWVTSWPFAQYVKHAWAGAWINSTFRNESDAVASELILDAVAATRALFGEPPALGCVSFVDPKHVEPTIRRGRAIYGYCYFKAGWRRAVCPKHDWSASHYGPALDCAACRSETKAGLWAWQLLPDAMPQPCPLISGMALVA